MNQLEYLPGIAGQSVQLDGPSAFVGVAEEMRSREWDYDLGYRDLVTATRPARTVDVTFHADYDTADTLRRVADADVMARTPGTFVAQKEWKQRGYILASDVDDIHYGRLSTGLKIALLDGAWWRLVDKTFMPEDTTPTYRSATGKSVTTDGAANVPLHALTVDGKAVQDGTPTPSSPVPIATVEPLVWNQLVQSMSTSTGDGITTAYDSTTGLFSITNDSRTANYASGSTRQAIVSSLVVGHKYYIGGNLIAGVGVLIDNSTGTLYQPGSVVSIASGSTFKLRVTNAYDFVNTHPIGDVTSFHLFVCDLTMMYGAGNEPTVEEFEAKYPDNYYPYDAGSNLFGIKVGGELTTIDLQGSVLASLPDGTKDVLTVDSAGHCVLTKNVAYVNMDGVTVKATDMRSPSGTATAYRFVILNLPYAVTISSSERSNFYCSVAVYNANAASTASNQVNGQASLYQYSSKPSLLFCIDGVSSVQDANTWFSTNLPKLAYKLATPEIIDLGYIDMPNVFDGAVVSVTAEVTPTITAEWQTSPDLYLDYPHNYPYDYQKTSSTESITPSVLTPSDVRLVIYGPAVNPYVIVGDNRYQVNTTVPSGGYLTVDGRDKTINLTLADGTVQNVFSSGVRGGGAGGGSYIFEQIPAGESEVTYDGSFGFDLGWYEEEGEPPWNQS